ncbi:MAG: hypothetical protein ACRC5T_07705 [Cetobacterium sp.]
MPIDTNEVGYDLISIANGTRAEVESAKSKLNTYELAIVTDEDKLVYKDSSGNIKEFTSGVVDELEARLDLVLDNVTTELEKAKEDVNTSLNNTLTVVNDNLEEIENKVFLEMNSKVGYGNFKGEYDSNKQYLQNDVVFMVGHELGYVHEIIDGGFSDPSKCGETRKDYVISDKMYYRYIGTDWEMILTELDEVSLNLYTIAHKPPNQNFETTWDSYFPYSEIGRYLINKDSGVLISKMDKVLGDRREGATTAVANDWNGTNGDIAVKLPKMYVNYRHTSKGKRIRFYSYKNPIKKVSLEAYIHPAFITDWEMDYMLVSATKGRLIGNQLRGCEGALTVSRNIAQFWADSRFGRSEEWNITTFQSSTLIADLFLMEFGHMNSQEILGQGRANTTDASGAGTTKTLGDRSGRVSTDDANGNVSYRGMEDCIANIWEFGLGLKVNDSGYYYTNKVSEMDNISKMTKLPVSTILLDLDNQRIKKYAKMSNYPTLNIPVEVGATDSTYYTDNVWFHDKGEENILLLGGAWIYASTCGLRTLSLASVASDVRSNLGARFTFFKKM